MKQEKLFLDSEADNWFKRNKGHFNIEGDLPLGLIGSYGLSPATVLEAGCSNGWRLNELAKRFPAVRCFGVEPSREAIADGRRQFKDIALEQGTLSAIPFKGVFDLVIVNYVFHWLDRGGLLVAATEVDRAVKDGGYLIIGDFSPDYPQRRQYHHVKDEIYTWKLPYHKIFLATGNYALVAFLTNDHDGGGLSADQKGAGRGFCALLRKSLTEFYPVV